jgi:hypothetical protein
MAVMNDDFDRAPDFVPANSTAAIAVTTQVNTYPTAAQAYYACKLGNLTGDEQEGNPDTVAASANIFMALNLGTQIPPQGTQIIAHAASNRWVFRFDG